MTLAINDLQNALVHGVSIAPGTQQAGDGTKNGSWVDMGESLGPVHGLVAIGNTDEYSVFDVSVKLQEADDSSGTNAQDINGTGSDPVGPGVETNTIASASATDNENTSVVVTAHNRSKRYVRAVVTINGTELSSGSSAITEISAIVAGFKAKV